MVCSDNYRVIIVDDDDGVRRTLERVLRRSYDVTTASNGEDAAHLLAEGHDYDVILCDLMMPGMTGDELYRHLARTRPAAARRVIFLSGCAHGDSVQRFLDSAPNPRLTKPIHPRRLREAIADHIRRLGAREPELAS